MVLRDGADPARRRDGDELHVTHLCHHRRGAVPGRAAGASADPGGGGGADRGADHPAPGVSRGRAGTPGDGLCGDHLRGVLYHREAAVGPVQPGRGGGDAVDLGDDLPGAAGADELGDADMGRAGHPAGGGGAGHGRPLRDDAGLPGRAAGRDPAGDVSAAGLGGEPGRLRLRRAVRPLGRGGRPGDRGGGQLHQLARGGAEAPGIDAGECRDETVSLLRAPSGECEGTVRGEMS